MSGLVRKTNFPFAVDSVNTGEFGTAQLGTKILTNDPLVIQGTTGSGSTLAPSAAWDAGWVNAVIGGNNLPPLEEMEGVQAVASYQLSYLLARGIPEYDSGTTYNAGDITRPPGGSQLYQSIGNANVANALPSAVTNSFWTYLGDLANLNKTALSINQQIFETSATYTPTAGMLFCQIECVGGGGSGAAGGPSVNRGGGGGGAGAYAVNFFSASTIGVSKAVTIGDGGAAVSGSSGTVAGNNGGTTSVGSLISAGGGTGAPAVAGVPAIDLGSGGSGSGSTTGSIFAGNGQGGGAGAFFSISSNVGGFSGTGGNSRIAGGGLGITGSSSTNGQNGGLGAGGSGSVDGGTSGAGGGGICIITEYI